MKEIKTKYILAICFVLLVCVSGFVFLLGKKLDKTPTVIKLEANTSTQQVYKYFIDFEDYRYLSNSSGIGGERALSGEKSAKIFGNGSYSPAIQIPVPTNDSTEMSDIDIRFWLSPTSQSIDMVWVFSIVDQNNNQVHWEGFPVKGDYFTLDNWYSFNHRFLFPKKFVNTGYTIKTYLWNKDKNNKPIYLDDVSISLRDQEEEGPRSKLIDFEDYNDSRISSKYAKSGFYSTSAKGKDGFSTAVIIPLKELKISNIQTIAFSFNYLSETSDLDAVFVVAIVDSTTKDLLWQGINLKKQGIPTKVWETANGHVDVPDELAKPENFIRIYLWNRNENQVFIDDIYIVIKEKTLTSDSIEPAFNMITSKTFQPRANRPPYKTSFVQLADINSNGALNLNKVFTQNSRVLVGKFDSAESKDQMFFSNSEGFNLLYFKNNGVELNKVKFDPIIDKNVMFFADEGQLFVCNVADNKIRHYKYNKQQKSFTVVGTIEHTNVSKISAIFLNIDNTLSVFENDGNVLTYQNKDNKYIKVSGNKFTSPNQGNLKVLKSDFFDTKKNDALLVYLENDKNKYVFLSYNESGKNWKMSGNTANNSVQSFDELDFVSDYFVVDYDGKGKKEILQFNKNKRFDLKLVDFDKITYNILFNIEFKGYAKKQNPKYYEVSKIVCGDFVGDNKSDIIIFQDNTSKIDWLTQKTEIYSFVGL